MQQTLPLRAQATRYLALATCLLIGTANSAHAGQPQVYHIPSLLPGGAGISEAQGISADGSVVVGSASSPRTINKEAYRWTITGGIEPLGDLPGGSFNSFSLGCAADGSVVTGHATPAGLNNAGFRWTAATGMTPLPQPPGLPGGTVGIDISADGSLIVGSSGNQACYWLNGVGHAIPRVNPANTSAEARGVSNDGSVIAGQEGTSLIGNATAFMWTAAGGTVLLPDIPGGTNNTIATAVSGGGQYIVGASRTASGTPRPVRWHNGVAEHIGLSAGGQPNPGVALDATADGSIVVGNIIFGNVGAFIWDEVHGYRNLNAALLEDYGLVVNFAKIGGISDDGLVIAGTDPGEVGLVVVLPEPGTLIGPALAVCLLARRRCG